MKGIDAKAFTVTLEESFRRKYAISFLGGAGGGNLGSNIGAGLSMGKGFGNAALGAASSAAAKMAATTGSSIDSGVSRDTSSYVLPLTPEEMVQQEEKTVNHNNSRVGSSGAGGRPSV